MTATYRRLDARQLVATIGVLHRRIRERFPESGLAAVAGELAAVGAATADQVAALARPHRAVRAAVWGLIGAMLVLLAVALATLDLTTRVDNLATLLQALESGVNDAVFVAVAVWFLATLETRIKRRRALRAIHELRSLAHIVDMHQLTKDPEQVLSPGKETASSPRRPMDRFALARYLDYCSELLSLTSKLAALYVQDLDDPVVLHAVSDVQTLTTGLSNKIWQKIVILDTVAR